MITPVEEAPSRPALRPRQLAASVLVVTVIGALIAVALDLNSKFVLGDEQRGDLGIEVIRDGSAISAPIPPVLALLVALALTRGSGSRRVVGLVLFAITGLLMTGGVIGEFASGTSFTGIDQAIFLLFSALYAVLAVSLVVTSVVSLVKPQS